MEDRSCGARFADDTCRIAKAMRSPVAGTTHFT
jgi:hypothetical protein